MSDYIETELTLDSLDLIMIQGLIEYRIKEVKQLQKENKGWVLKHMGDEQIDNYRSTLKKIKSARENVKRIKKEADDKFFTNLKTRKLA